MRTFGSAMLLGIALLACTSQPNASPTPSATSAANNNTIVFGLPLPPFAASPFIKISNAFGFRPPLRAEIVTQLVYNGLYRYDDSLSPVPDLAAEPCTVAPDLVSITCSLVAATFHNGALLTADDVAFTYELARRDPKCRFGFGECLGSKLASVRAIDGRTVEFRLTAPDATFLTLTLPSVMIDSRHVVEEAYAPLGERAQDLDAADYQRGAAEIATELEAAEPDCARAIANVDALSRAAGLEPLPRDQFNGPDGKFDACLYAEESAALLEDIAASLDATGLDAIALAYQALAFNRSPIGTGPWRFVSVEDGTRAIFEAFDAYYRGPPATHRIEVRVIRDPSAALAGLRSGELDWVPLPADLFAQIEGESNLQFVAYPDSIYFVLTYNLRPGMPFADRDLRTAVELCIDKPATVDAATHGTGDVVYSPIEPISWAYEPNLPKTDRDVAGARRLIEGAGWLAGADGVYAREGARLAADVYVRADDAQRLAFVDLLAEQLRDCGIELNSVPAKGDAVLDAVAEYPHIMPGADKPFETVFLAFSTAYDPHDETWHSRSVSSAEHPNGENFMGFTNAEADALLDAGIATYDQRERARIYRDFQVLLARDKPVLFAWAGRLHEALNGRLGLTEGALNFRSRQWMWQLEKLVLR